MVTCGCESGGGGDDDDEVEKVPGNCSEGEDAS